MEERGVCEVCAIRPRAINYKKAGKTYYRSKCNQCMKYGGAVDQYTCVMCGFRARYEEQLVPAEKADDNICLNCEVVREKERKEINQRLKPVADL